MGDGHVEILEELELPSAPRLELFWGGMLHRNKPLLDPITMSNRRTSDGLEVLVIVFSSCFDCHKCQCSFASARGTHFAERRTQDQLPDRRRDCELARRPATARVSIVAETGLFLFAERFDRASSPASS